jgi:hypothetical protein
VDQSRLRNFVPTNRAFRADQQITVPNIVVDEGQAPATRIEVGNDRQTVKAYGPSGDLVAFYPVTVGIEEKPSPVGTFKITSIDRNPNYRYKPKYNFKGVRYWSWAKQSCGHCVDWAFGGRLRNPWHSGALAGEQI